MRSMILPTATAALLLISPVLAVSADWPTWRHDVTRSGTSSEELPRELHLRWSRALPEPQVAWPNEPRLQFDAANEPIVLGKTLFIGSACDGSLRACDTESGEARWAFFTEGPIRCAPVAWQDKVYAGSDDGYFYCLNATTGKELWKLRGAPADRPDYRQLGNTRLISYWPVRGGAVLHEGTVYFGAGIWPSMGVFIHAVDARTGKIRWSNREVNYIEQVRLDHNDLQEAGLSPQGYFLFVDGKLHVPNGRSMPAGFDPTTGELLQYVQGYHRGDSRVTASGKYLFVGEGGIVKTEDGREVGERWTAAGKDAPELWKTSKIDLFEGPIFGYNFAQGCNFRSAFDRGIAYGVSKGFLRAHDLNKADTSLYETQKGSYTYHPTKWDAPELWTRHRIAEEEGASTGNMIKAGSRLYIHVDHSIVMVDVSWKQGARPEVVGTLAPGGTPAGMIAADGKLFVSLTDGRLVCFGEQPSAVETHPRPIKPLVSRTDSASQQAARILEQSGVSEGYALLLGVDNERLIEELLQQSQLHVIAVDRDREKVNALRQWLTDARQYGTRAEVFVGDPLTFRFPPYLASLIVTQPQLLHGASSPTALAHFYNILRPYGGLLWLTGHETDLDQVRVGVTQAKLASAQITRKGESLLVSRVGALPGSADWTHEGCTAARTYYSRDDLVRSPLAILWYGDGPDHGFFKRKDYGRGVKPQVAGGRWFAFDDIRQILSGVDAYTGRLLWNFNTGTDYVRFASRLDGVYVGRNQQCDRLDPATGKIEKTYPCQLEQQSGRSWGVADIRVTDDRIFVAFGYDLPEGHSHQTITSGLWDCEALVAMDKQSGKQLWVKYPKQRYNIHAIAAGEGVVFVTDSISPVAVAELSRRGELPKTMPSTTYARDATTGEVKWEFTAKYDPRNLGKSWQSVRANDDWISFSQDENIVLLGKWTETTAIDATSGKTLWKNRSGLQPIILRDDTFINQAGRQYSITTGELASQPTFFRKSGGCNYAVGSKHLTFVRNRSVTYFDVSDQKEYSLRNLRSGCSNSLVAADGLLNMPCFSYGCVCNYPLQTSLSMWHMPESAEWAGEKPFPLLAPKQ